MTFDRLWVLLLLPLPMGWLAWEWRRQTHRAPLVLKTGMVVALILALRARCHPKKPDTGCPVPRVLPDGPPIWNRP